MDLKSFSNTEPYSDYRDPKVMKENNSQKKSTATNGPKETDVREAINHFSKMPNDQLVLELAKQIAIQKSKGNTGNMKATLEKIKPILSAEQRAKLDAVLREVEF